MLMLILFDNPSKAYFAGQIVNGRVVIRVQQKPKKFRDITVTFRGKAYVKWTEDIASTTNGGGSASTVISDTHKGSERYLENYIQLAGETTLQPGEYDYPFTFRLPHNIPSSFEYKSGSLIAYIRYTIKAVMNRPWRFNHDCKTAFTVISPLDLNYSNPTIKTPVDEQFSKIFSTLFRKSGPLNVRIQLPCSGYVPGQTVPLTIAIQNKSHVSVHPINCALKKELTFHSTSGGKKKKKAKVVITQFALNQKVQPKNSNTFLQMFNIPPLPPSNLHHCKIIDIDYYLKVDVGTGAFHKNLVTKIPVTIGTVPLHASPATVSTPVSATNPSAPKNNTIPPVPNQLQPPPAGFNPAVYSSSATQAPPAYEDLPPPSYEESIFGGMSIKEDDDNAHTMGLCDFTPRYPVWKFDVHK